MHRVFDTLPLPLNSQLRGNNFTLFDDVKWEHFRMSQVIGTANLGILRQMSDGLLPRAEPAKAHRAIVESSDE